MPACRSDRRFFTHPPRGRVQDSAIHGDAGLCPMFQRAYVAMTVLAAAGVASAADALLDGLEVSIHMRKTVKL